MSQQTAAAAKGVSKGFVVCRPVGTIWYRFPDTSLRITPQVCRLMILFD